MNHAQKGRATDFFNSLLELQPCMTSCRGPTAPKAAVYLAGHGSSRMRVMMMMCTVLVAAGRPACAQPEPPQAPFDPPLRAYSKLMAVMVACGRAYPINVPRVKEYAAAMLELAEKAGAQQPNIKAEYDRRAAEVRITGIRPWCMSARAGLREDGASELFPER